jgi:hypothetical protein
MGFVGGATMGASLVVQAAAGLLVGGLATMAGKAVDEGSDFKWDWTQFAIGTAGGLMQGAGAKAGEKFMGSFFKHHVGKYAAKVMGKKSQIIFGKTVTKLGWFRDVGEGAVMPQAGFWTSLGCGGVRGLFSGGFKMIGETAANPDYWPDGPLLVPGGQMGIGK